MGNFEKFLGSSPEIYEIAEGLNQVYLLTSIPSRLALLWAITEKFFKDKPERLLTDSAIAAILEAASRLTTLHGTPFEELKNALSDPDRLPLKSRNRCIAENLAKKLELDMEAVYKEITKASKARGLWLHELKSDNQKIIDSEKYLRWILERYLEKNKT